MQCFRTWVTPSHLGSHHLGCDALYLCIFLFHKGTLENICGQKINVVDESSANALFFHHFTCQSFHDECSKCTLLLTPLNFFSQAGGFLLLKAHWMSSRLYWSFSSYPVTRSPGSVTGFLHHFRDLFWQPVLGPTPYDHWMCWSLHGLASGRQHFHNVSGLTVNSYSVRASLELAASLTLTASIMFLWSLELSRSSAPCHPFSLSGPYKLSVLCKPPLPFRERWVFHRHQLTGDMQLLYIRILATSLACWTPVQCGPSHHSPWSGPLCTFLNCNEVNELPSVQAPTLALAPISRVSASLETFFTSCRRSVFAL